jgi:hypothetical protein
MDFDFNRWFSANSVPYRLVRVGTSCSLAYESNTIIEWRLPPSVFIMTSIQSLLHSYLLPRIMLGRKCSDCLAQGDLDILIPCIGPIRKSARIIMSMRRCQRDIAGFSKGGSDSQNKPSSPEREDLWLIRVHGGFFRTHIEEDQKSEFSTEKTIKVYTLTNVLILVYKTFRLLRNWDYERRLNLFSIRMRHIPPQFLPFSLR